MEKRLDVMQLLFLDFSVLPKKDGDYYYAVLTHQEGTMSLVFVCRAPTREPF